MLTAGMFEYNFGDSEFLMLFLLLVTLPYAADRVAGDDDSRRRAAARRLTDARHAAPTRGSGSPGRSILVIGDVMLDHFVIGRVERISPEAPVPVVRFEHDEYRLGGAANVAHNIAALGGRAELVGPGRRRCRSRTAARRARGAVDRRAAASSPTTDRCTTRKLRVVTTRNQQVARIDYESDREVSRRPRGAPSSSESTRSRRRSTRSSSPTT